MSSGDVSVEQDPRRAEPVRSLGLVVLGALIVFLVWLYNRPLSVDLIWINYPINREDSDSAILVVERNQDTLLNEQMVRRGTFDIDKLFQELLGQLVNTWDEEKRVDQSVGVVRIWFSNKTSGTYLIYDEKYADELFDWARTNLVEAP